MSQTDAIRTLTEEEYRTFNLKRNGEFNYEIGGKLCLVRYVNGCRDRDPQADEPIQRFIEIEIGEEEVKRAEHSYRQRERERNWSALDDGQIARMVREQARAHGNKIWEKNRKKVRAKTPGRKKDDAALVLMAQHVHEIVTKYGPQRRSVRDLARLLAEEFPRHYPKNARGDLNEKARNVLRKLIYLWVTM